MKLLTKRILFVVAFILLSMGVLYRSSGLQYHMWEDEVHHNEVILKSHSLMELRKDLCSQSQPILEYAIRKLVWFKFLNPINDTALRIPSAFYAILTLITGFYFFWRKGKIYNAVFFVILFFAAGIEIQYAHEARHYSFVSLAGLLFVMALLNLLDCSSNNKKYGARLFLFYLSSLLLLNSHFFSFFLVSGCLFIILCRDIEKKNLLIINALSILLVFGVTALVNYPALQFLLQAPPGKLDMPFSILSFPWQDAYRLFLGFLEDMSQIGMLKEAFSIIEFPYLLPAIIMINLVVNFSRKRMAFYSSVLMSLYLLLLCCRYKSDYGFGERYVIFYSPILVILTIDSILTLLFSAPVIYKKLFNWRHLSSCRISKAIKVIVGCFFIYFALISLKDFSYKYESIQKPEDIRMKDSIKSLALYIRQEGGRALILELSAVWEMDQWDMYLNYLYKNDSYNEFPVSNVVTRCLGTAGVNDIDDLKNEGFNVIYIGNVYENPDKVKFKSDIYIFDSVYFYIKIYRKDNEPMKYDDIINSLKIMGCGFSSNPTTVPLETIPAFHCNPANADRE